MSVHEPQTAAYSGNVPTGSSARRRQRIRRLLAAGAGILVGTIVVGAAIGLGVLQTMTQSFAARAVTELPAQPRIDDSTDQLQVAVALGVGGSVVADALAPFGIFAKSETFNVFTVSTDRAPVGLSGGLTAIPDFSMADIRSGRAPEADIIVVPAFADPAGEANRPIREWIQDAHAGGVTVLGVCAGARVLAAAGVLEQRSATSHFADLDDLEAKHPETTWIRGERFVDDGRITTTAGVTSGIAGALHLVERFAGAAEAKRIGDEVGASEWGPTRGTRMAVHRTSPEDYPYTLGAALPWFRPTWGVALAPGSDEIDVAAAFEVYSSSSFAASLVPIATAPTIRTKHGLTLVATTPEELEGGLDRMVVPGVSDADVEPLIRWSGSNAIPIFIGSPKAGESSIAPFVRDLAQVTDVASATTLAKYIEYPVNRLEGDAALPFRLFTLIGSTVLLGAAVGILTWMLARRDSRLRAVIRRPLRKPMPVRSA